MENVVASKTFPSLILLLMLSFALTNTIKLGGSAAYLIPPIIWLAMFTISYSKIRPGVLPYRSIVSSIVLVACLSIFIIITLGFVTGFGLSSYIMSVQGLVFNMFFLL